MRAAIPTWRSAACSPRDSTAWSAAWLRASRPRSIPLLDHHCHALQRPGAALDGAAFRRHFSESTDPAMAPHLSFSLFYQRGLRDLAALLGCEPSEEAVLAARRSVPLDQYARRLL